MPDHGLDVFYKQYADTNWQKHLQVILDGAKFMAKALVNGQNILVHCSDGWDRTAQLTSLVQILCDPYFRTVHGFKVVVEKEWIKFGHKFEMRCLSDKKQVAPIFHQFLECLYLILVQFPNAFEYTEELLLSTFYAVYSKEFGNFIGNNEYERQNLNFVSFWDSAITFNPLYQKVDGVLFINTHPSRFKFWNNLYKIK